MAEQPPLLRGQPRPYRRCCVDSSVERSFYDENRCGRPWRSGLGIGPWKDHGGTTEDGQRWRSRSPDELRCREPQGSRRSDGHRSPTGSSSDDVNWSRTAAAWRPRCECGGEDLRRVLDDDASGSGKRSSGCEQPPA